jgi:ABC-type antimicrobial peptide transport system permease subunit
LLSGKFKKAPQKSRSNPFQVGSIRTPVVSKANTRPEKQKSNSFTINILHIRHPISNNPKINQTTMLRNYLRIALRHMATNKALSFINIAGLALGMAGAILLLLNIQFNLSTDNFHTKKDRIYLTYNKGVVDGAIQCWGATAAPLGPALKKEFPEVLSVTRIAPTGKLLQYGDKLIKSEGYYTDPAFLTMFTFPLARGSAATLADPTAILLTENLAHTLFGDDDPMNKTVVVENRSPLTVRGILKDPPYNSRFRFDYLLPWAYGAATELDNKNWNNLYVNTYVELPTGIDLETINRKVSNISTRHGNQETAFSNFFYPLPEVYLRGRFTNGKPNGGQIDNIRMLGILAGVILLIACINFMNLGTARSEKRAKEVGVRKVIGAGRLTLIIQFVGESVVFAAIAGGFALLLVKLVLPQFSQMARVHLSLDWLSFSFWLYAAGFVVLTGVLAGSYPAFFLSSFKPVRVLKGMITNGKALVTPRKILVVVQFVLAIFLINFTLLFRRQVQYTMSRPIGYNKKNLLSQPMTAALRKNYSSLKNELIGAGIADAVSQSSALITQNRGSITGLKWPGMDPKANPSFDFITTQGGFIQTNGLHLLEGRDIDVAAHPGDTLSCVINEAAARLMKIKHPTGQSLSDEGISWKIVGVVNDFLSGNPNQETSPAIIRGQSDANFISIRLNAKRPPVANTQAAEAILKKYNPGFLTEIRFADEDYAAKFREEQNTGNLINGFALVAIFVSCMGLLGLSIYMAENRIREVGIRKVLGASITGISLLLTRDFIRLILISIVVASPLAWLFMNIFLRHLSYHVSPSVWILLTSGILALLIAIATVSFHSIRAAMANPVKSLRTE